MKSTEIRIAHITEALTGGISTYLRMVLPALAKTGFRITLICSLNRNYADATELLASFKENGIDVRILPMSRRIRIVDDIRAFIGLYKIVSNRQFDIIHTHCSKAGCLGRLAAFLAGTKIIVHTPHCFGFVRCGNWLKGKLYLYLERILGTITTQLVAVSKSDANIATTSYVIPRSRCTVICNALPEYRSLATNERLRTTTENKGRFHVSGSTRVVTTVCRLVKYKGIMRFLEAAKRSRADNTVFLVAGEGELRSQAEQFIRRHHLDRKVRLLGHVREIEALYTISDVIVLCSDAEGQPYTLLEAMRAKCAIVATSVPGTRELLSHNKTGYLAMPTASSIAYWINSLLDNERLRNKLATNAYEYFRKHHLLQAQISKLTTIYRSHVPAIRKDKCARSVRVSK